MNARAKSFAQAAWQHGFTAKEAPSGSQARLIAKGEKRASAVLYFHSKWDSLVLRDGRSTKVTEEAASIEAALKLLSGVTAPTAAAAAKKPPAPKKPAPRKAK